MYVGYRTVKEVLNMTLHFLLVDIYQIPGKVPTVVTGTISETRPHMGPQSHDTSSIRIGTHRTPTMVS